MDMKDDIVVSKFSYIGEFVPKPRMTRRDMWAKRPIVVHYYEYKDRLNLFAKSQKFELGDKFDIKFVIRMPDSWSNKKRDQMRGRAHQSRPDIDNLVKGVMDAMMKQDMYVWDIHAQKVWGDDNAIYIQNT